VSKPRDISCGGGDFAWCSIPALWEIFCELKLHLHCNSASTGGVCYCLLRRIYFCSERMNADILAKAKSLGFSDRQIANLIGKSEDEVRALRKKLGLVPSYRLVDTCAAEFEAYTPYYYSTYDRGDDEVRATPKRKVMILGGGPNRIGQG